MKPSTPFIVCLALLTLQPSCGDDDKYALVVSKHVKDLIEQKETSEFVKVLADDVKQAVKKVGGVGCAAGAFIGGMLGNVFGAAVGCHAGVLITGLIGFAQSVGRQWSEQMRRAMLAWEMWKRSHKHLRITPGKEEKVAYRECAKDVHPDKALAGAAAEDLEFMKEMFADCKFAGEYIKAFKAKYGVHNFGQKIDFYKKFAGTWAYAFAPEQQISEEEIAKAENAGKHAKHGDL